MSDNTFGKEKCIAFFLVSVLGLIFVYAVFGLHTFGELAEGSVAEQYLHNGSGFTGSTNIVNSIVWDFRGFDTLGEETVFFAGALGVVLVTKGIRKHRKCKK